MEKKPYDSPGGYSEYNSSPTRVPAHDPPPVHPDEASWPESTLWKGRRIKKTDIKKFYRLDDDDLQELEFKTDDRWIETPKNKKRSGILVDTKRYKEREVERIAWRKHGGPEGFKAYLDLLKERWDQAQAKKQPADRKPFPAPVSYVPSQAK
ncbi:hypothetical protein AURDEDRAFT_177347 [Auricularia subglabra TFB-10046 SS5]|uniref:Uncharacterized protein n=1 Tax=Auricularia subglabra (strain TFB-10046 / SS5) TaxID=717982 RepID=J0CTE5_AURST|nr:hypothetical protein AURDEDRAFT_177347 [Auricularia subglabra TFB-10046 SS5]